MQACPVDLHDLMTMRETVSWFSGKVFQGCSQDTCLLAKLRLKKKKERKNEMQTLLFRLNESAKSDFWLALIDRPDQNIHLDLLSLHT